ncbi:MAG: 4Fe-4S binding protein [candidate division WOR-3 bacterium]
MTWLRYIRVAAQIIFLGLFIYFFLVTATVTRSIFINPFFSADPLIFTINSIATRIMLSIGLPLMLIILSLIFGRFFCGFICPLGILIDWSGSFIGRHKPRKGDDRKIKYYILLTIFISAILGGSLVYIFDPLVIVGRSFTTVLRLIVSVFQDNALLHNGFLFLGILLIILGLNLIRKRFWCQSLCPLGALFALISRWSILRFTFKKSCNECHRCRYICPTGAISVELRAVSQLECVRCLRCLEACRESGISLAFALPATPPQSLNLSRRGLITSIGLGIITIPLLKTEIFKKINPNRVIRPPGSIPEELFIDACIRCGECVKICPTNGLQPVLLQRGFGGLFTPQLIPRIGGCERNCNGCGQVCPTGAIRKLELKEKDFVKIGTAVIHKEMCLAWEQDKLCLICDEACPYNAIESKMVDILGNKLLRPFVKEELCTGCGICESRCPITGPSAIEVFPIGEERLLTGSYINEQKIRLRELLGQESEEDIPTGFME